MDSGRVSAPPHGVEQLEGTATTSGRKKGVNIVYRQYTDEDDLPLIMRLVDNELSEPYSIFTYRYFLHNWPSLCYLAFHGSHCFGTIVCKLDSHGEFLRGYIAMLVVEQAYRGLGVGSALVRRAITEMKAGQADEVVLEAETNNKGALALYENLGFIRDKRLIRYYLSGTDAFRLKLLLPLPPERLQQMADEQLAAEELMRLHLKPPGSDPSQQSPPDEASTENGGSHPTGSAQNAAAQSSLTADSGSAEKAGDPGLAVVGASGDAWLTGSSWEGAGKLSEAEKLGLVAESRSAEMGVEHDREARLTEGVLNGRGVEGAQGAQKLGAGRPKLGRSQGSSGQASKPGKKGKRTKK